MELSEHSKNRLLNSFKNWYVAEDFAMPMFNYLVHGFQPGSFFTAVLANDFAMAMLRSHPSNKVEAIKCLVKWMLNEMPHDAFGSNDKVEKWLHLEESQRRKILEEHCLVFSVEDETWMILKDVPVDNKPWGF